MSENHVSLQSMSGTAGTKVAPGGGVRRCAESRRAASLALAAAVMLLGGCGGDRAVEDAGPRIEYRRFVAVEVASRPDSAAAATLRDSLEAAGWVAYLRSGDGTWRVRVAPSPHLAWAELVAAALGGAAVAIRDSGTVAPQGIEGVTRVNYESPGMFTRLRWITSPERDAILVMEDAASVENDPAPNGFVFASEPLRTMLQMDSVWDAAPAPDWQRVGFGRAYGGGARLLRARDRCAK